MGNYRRKKKKIDVVRSFCNAKRLEARHFRTRKL